ncbi:MAG TPA: hypothetical protein VFL59_10795 [Candidatus Nanopelagicales bacterium]|nr:hypothetical protein [Candidatus Nanopelagicales bacterium]
MKRASASVAVDKPILEVFRYLAEGRNNPTWRVDVTLAARIRGSATDLGAGTVYLQKVVDRSGRSVEESYEIITYQPPHLLEMMYTRGSTQAIGRYSLAAINTVTTHVEFTLQRVSPEFRASRRRDYRSQLQDRVDSIHQLPAAMRDEGAVPL